MSRILIVDDDPYIRELVQTLLKNEDFDVFEACDGREALSKFSEIEPELCIIDVMMPVMDGFELCRNIRKYYKDMPVLMLTAKGDISQKVKGFELGTDDYLTKPFDMQELIVRVKALLRRFKLEDTKTLKVGELVIDESTFSILADGKYIDLPMKEFELLMKLVSAEGRTVTRDQIIEDVWGYDFDGNERTLDVHISRLRDRFPQEKYKIKITTIRGLGYRLEEC